MRNLLLPVLILPLAACDFPANPVVAEFNGDSVTIVTSQLSNAEEARAAAKSLLG